MIPLGQPVGKRTKKVKGGRRGATLGSGTYLADLHQDLIIVVASEKAHSEEEQHRVPGGTDGLIDHHLGDGVAHIQGRFG